MKRLHRVLIIGLEVALQEALFEDKYADKVIEKTLKANKKWGSKDRAFVAESFYDIIRWKRKLAHYMGEEITQDNIYKLMATYLIYSNYKSLFLRNLKLLKRRKYLLACQNPLPILP